MPRPKKQPAEPLAALQSIPHLEPVRDLSPEERIELRKIVNHPIFVRAWSLAESKRPSVLVGDFESALGAQHSLARIHELRGWQLFQRHFLSAVSEPIRPPAPPPMNYPAQ